MINEEYKVACAGRDDTTNNCAGCKWLDQVQHYATGEGYCCMVERSKGYKLGDKARYSNSKRCELYEAGDFRTRHEKQEEKA